MRQELRTIRSDFWVALSGIIQDFFEAGNAREYFKEVKRVYNGTAKTNVNSCGWINGQTQRLRKIDGTLTETDEEDLHRFAEHFQELFNQPGTVGNDVEQYLPVARPEMILVRSGPFTMEEMTRAFHQLKNDKAAGSDDFGIEIEKYAASPTYLRKLLNLYNSILKTGEVPAQWKDVMISVIHKKGNTEECNNYRGLSLMCHKGKVLELLIRNRISPAIYGANPIVPENQFGFRANCGTHEPILISHLITTSAKEYQVPLYKCYIDLTKAYDKVNRDLLWRILELYGIPDLYIKIIRAMHDGAQARVRWKAYISESFPLQRGLKQGSTISPLLWNIFFGFLTKAVEREFALDPTSGVKIWFDMDGEMIDKTVGGKLGQNKETTIWLVCYADDCIIFARTEESLQKMLNIFHRICTAFGMEISVEKTKVMRINGAIEDGIILERARRAKNTLPLPRETNIYVDGRRLEAVHQFNYLGCIENEDNTMRTEVSKRQYKMISMFEQYAGRVLQNPRLTTKARIGVFKTIIIPNGVYACNTWNLRERDRARLEKTYMFLLRKTIGITAKVYEECGTEHIFSIAKQKGVVIHSLECYIELYQLRYLWKLQRLGEDKLCGIMMHGRVYPRARGRKRGRPATTYRHCLTEALQHFDVTYNDMVTSKWAAWLAKLHGTGIDRAMDRVEFLADAHLHISDADPPSQMEMAVIHEVPEPQPTHVSIFEVLDQRNEDMINTNLAEDRRIRHEIAAENEAAFILFWENLNGGIRNHSQQIGPSPEILATGSDDFFREERQIFNGTVVAALSENNVNDANNQFQDGAHNALSNGTENQRPNRKERRRLRGYMLAERKRQRCDQALTNKEADGAQEATWKSF